MKQRAILLVFLCLSAFSFALPPDSIQYNKGKPSRIIRTCCAFGVDVSYFAIPFVKNSDIIAPDQLDKHHYLGSKNEGNGIIYTRLGGFIDLGHLRDCADWTAFLYQVIQSNKGNLDFKLVLGHEAGKKELKLSVPEHFSKEDALLLAGRIAYDLSVWHEIATWYGASSVPFVPERYSSFSAEDDYSNRLGIQLGIIAIAGALPYDEAMTQLIEQKLKKLRAVNTLEETYRAMEMVEGIWWSKYYPLPSKRFLLTHEVSSYEISQPMVINELIPDGECTEAIALPLYSHSGIPLTNYFDLSFRLNGKLPINKLFNEKKKGRWISNSDFNILLDAIENDTRKINYNKLDRIERRTQHRLSKQ